MQTVRAAHVHAAIRTKAFTAITSRDDPGQRGVGALRVHFVYGFFIVSLFVPTDARTGSREHVAEKVVRHLVGM